MTNAEIRSQPKARNPWAMTLAFGLRRLGLTLALLLSPAVAFGQRSADQRPPPLDPAQAKSEARALVAELLAQRPAQSSTNTGRIRIRDRDGKEVELAARFEIISTPTNWVSVYETFRTSSGLGGERLAVTHSDTHPNQYQLLERGSPATTNAAPRQLTPEQTMMPFAGSDFCAADLGLEFLHWPQQRLLKKEMRHSKSCSVLESVNPQPAPGGYARVVSWIIVESPHGIVHADAYDTHNERIKEFDPVNLEKVRGDYQLEEVEMRNKKTGSHTWIKFDLDRQ
jgi:hypothetical protein